jgi:hypothetical protein
MMRPVLYVLTFLGLIALGFWAYRENYATQATLREVRALQQEIAGLREALSVQRAEWAYLNRPDRLRDLATLNFDRLGLLPMEPGQFGAVAQVVMPAPEVPAITGPIDTMGGVTAVEDTFADQVEAIVAAAVEEGL